MKPVAAALKAVTDSGIASPMTAAAFALGFVAGVREQSETETTAGGGERACSEGGSICAATEATVRAAKAARFDKESKERKDEGKEQTPKPTLRAEPHLQAELCAAVEDGDVEAVRKLLAVDGADPSVAEDAYPTFPPILLAAQNGHDDVVRALLEYDADPNQAQNDIGVTPVYSAAENGEVGVVLVLLGHHADPNIGTAVGATPVYIAAQQGFLDVVQALLGRNADPNRARTDDGDTPLCAAVQNGHAAAATLLLEHNADPNTPNTFTGQTLFQTAVGTYNFAAAASLVAHGANPTPASSSSSNAGAVSPLYLAAEAGALDLVEQLLKCAHGVEAPTASGRADVQITPIDVAAHNNHLEVVQLLNAAAAPSPPPPATSSNSGGDDEGEGGAALHAQPQALPASPPPLLPRVSAVLAAESSLFPPPPAVLHWFRGGSYETAAGDPQYDLAKQATEWLIAVVAAAHASPRAKQAGRKLMACYTFTANLDFLMCWSQRLIPALTATLVALGAQAKAASATAAAAAVLTTANLEAAAPYNTAVLPAGAATPRSQIRQDALMPSLTAAVSTDYDRDWRAQPEHVYIHMLLLLATALNPVFGAAMEVLLSELDGVEVHVAAIKSFTRMVNKLMAADDHRYVEQKPRPAMNIDIVRRLASARSAEDVVELVTLVAARFGGLSHLKCLPELAATDPAAAGARYYMLPVMVTVVFAPAGWTVGGLVADEEVRAAWAGLRAAQPSAGMSSEQWQLDHDTAVRLLETQCDPAEPVRMHCEVQVLTTGSAAVRHQMHEMYKVVRAADGPQLHADVAKPKAEAAVDVDALVRAVGGGGGVAWGYALFNAAVVGRIATVKGLLAACTGSGRAGGAGGGADVNFTLEDTGMTAVYAAVEGGHFSVVLALLAHNADPNLARFEEGTSPVYIAAQGGHVAILKLLLEHGADVNQAKTSDGQTAVYTAAENGHLDVVQELLAHNADPNLATTDEYQITPVFVAAQEGHLDIVTALVDAGGRTGTAVASYGATDLWAACWRGHVDVVQYLLAQPSVDANRARSDARDAIVGEGDDPHPGTTPLEVAVLEGHTAVADLLKLHGAA